MKKVGFVDDPNLNILLLVANALGELCDELVFIGGCATGLLLTKVRAELIRATQDVDVVAQALTLAQYHDLERKIAARGFTHDISSGSSICRWVCQGVKLDLMPTQPDILGFHNRWYPLAVEAAEQVIIPGGKIIRLITGPVFIATKLEAFHGRGASDFLMSHDLEDILTVIDGRPELITEVQNANSELRHFLAHEFSALLTNADFLAAMPGHLPADAASQARLPELIARIKQLTKISPAIAEKP